MNPLQKAALLISGIFIWVFGLSIGMAWYSFGYLDVSTSLTMGVMLLPLLCVAVAVLIYADTRDREIAREKPDAKSDVRPVKAPKMARHGDSRRSVAEGKAN